MTYRHSNARWRVGEPTEPLCFTRRQYAASRGLIVLASLALLACTLMALWGEINF